MIRKSLQVRSSERRQFFGEITYGSKKISIDKEIAELQN